ncbi:tRNA glutamyl-Q(34) synthetase GluQRS [Rhodopirellula halodulae]|uniref:tRNA glutamyl-Q(34) synthetase GluQRS n=1 Tax=Rhodopirellula halodulae TaxID=2894198 RepID=UPI001E2917A7|nr:tRNA glutamyl-Q(34) synthetase GluQRS [Rhodopirellula sp. JC737]MCC9655164.1 tRNA glutamyl-Q(34) synthetase GluQRS [Rhodopirellula sp. JC737]
MTRGVCRLAPSPTGAQHLGNARTFLIAYWSARSQDARLILRIEDIDSPRVKPWATQQAITDLRWLGMDWDGEPIIQTERSSLYDEARQKLLDDNRIYPCTCTRRDIEAAASAPHESPASGWAPDAPVYPGTCSTWQNGEPLPTGKPFCFRYRMNAHPNKFTDLVHGEVTCDPLTDIGDFPITRKAEHAEDCLAAYQLAVVIDDIDAGVTEVVRGDDLILSTFRQLQLYESLGQTPPAYAHVPLVTGTDGRRLAKRHGDTRLSHFRDQGMPPETIVQWAAESSGLMATKSLDGLTMHQMHRQMIEQFDWDRIQRLPTIVESFNETE